MIQIEESKIVEAAEKGMDEFLKIFTDAYLEALEVILLMIISINSMDINIPYLLCIFFIEEVNVVVLCN